MAVAGSVFATMALAEDSVPAIGHWQDWAVFAEGGVCWAGTTAAGITSDTSEIATPTAFSDRLLVTFFPEYGGAAEVSFLPRTPFDADSPVHAQIGQQSIALFTQDGILWPANDRANDDMLAAMLVEASFVIRLIGADGHAWRYRFSNNGLAQAMDAAKAFCDIGGFAIGGHLLYQRASSQG
jgi:hypothetical protein